MRMKWLTELVVSVPDTFIGLEDMEMTGYCAVNGVCWFFLKTLHLFTFCFIVTKQTFA